MDNGDHEKHQHGQLAQNHNIVIRFSFIFFAKSNHVKLLKSSLLFLLFGLI